jgi:hypothetical protein
MWRRRRTLPGEVVPRCLYRDTPSRSLEELRSSHAPALRPVALPAWRYAMGGTPEAEAPKNDVPAGTTVHKMRWPAGPELEKPFGFRTGV